MLWEKKYVQSIVSDSHLSYLTLRHERTKALICFQTFHKFPNRSKDNTQNETPIFYHDRHHRSTSCSQGLWKYAPFRKYGGEYRCIDWYIERWSAGGRHMLLPTVMVGCVLPAVPIHWTIAPAAANHRPVAADCVFLQSADKKHHTHTHCSVCLTPPWRRKLRTKSSHSPTAKLPIIFAVLPASALVRPIAVTRTHNVRMIVIAAIVSSSI